MQFSTSVRQFAKRCLDLKSRSMSQFAEEEIIVPDGEYQGMAYSIHRQPYVRHFFDAVDSGNYNRFAAVGPTQSGKSLSCFVIPLVYHLFEMHETVVCGVPDLSMVNDKWREDIVPVIERTRYRDLMPNRGEGSKGGTIKNGVTFQNGATLRFLTGGGGDKRVAGFTARIACITEVDGMDVSRGESRETDRVRQIEARTLHYGNRRRIYLECTASTSHGRIWKEYTGGTRTEIVLLCPYCGRGITGLRQTQETWRDVWREKLVGWKDAANEIQAEEQSHFNCPECDAPWTEEDRFTANLESTVIHNNTKTRTFGFRWSAINNFFFTPAQLGAQEWKHENAGEESDLDEVETCQFVWALPFDAGTENEVIVTGNFVRNKQNDFPQGMVEEGSIVTVGLDLAMRRGHWVVLASKDYVTTVADYGVLQIPSDEWGIEAAMASALRDFKDEITEQYDPEQVWIDARYQNQIVLDFIKDGNHPQFRPCLGFGMDQIKFSSYNPPKDLSRQVHHTGNHYHMYLDRAQNCYIVSIDSSYWKLIVHSRFLTPKGKPNSLELAKAPHKMSHLAYSKHVTAERCRHVVKPGVGTKLVWEVLRKTNHWFDSTYLATAAYDYVFSRQFPEEYKTTYRSFGINLGGVINYEQAIN